MKSTQKKQNTIVMAFGTFDYLHAGHKYYLQEAKKLGDELIVIIARDKTVKQIKGELPTNSEQKRLRAIRDLQIADKVMLGYHRDKHKVIRKFRPDIIALGYDQFTFTHKLKKTLIDFHLNTAIHRIEAHHPQIYKSSLLKRNARNNGIEQQSDTRQYSFEENYEKIQ